MPLRTALPAAHDCRVRETEAGNVQIVERSDVAVRAVIYRLASQEHALEFELFPMIHVAEQRFYDSVRGRLENCDLVLYEGVAGTRVSIATQSYRLIAKRRRLGLVYQGDALRRSDIETRWVHADLSAPEFGKAWVRAPLWQRLAVYFAAPILGAYRYLTATRDSIARSLETTDLSPQDDLPLDDRLDALMDAFLTRRDGHLLACILRLHQEHRASETRAGILYGAAHIPPVVRLLQDRLGYRVQTADWVTVFEL
jgi:hypothetical protein